MKIKFESKNKKRTSGIKKVKVRDWVINSKKKRLEERGISERWSEKEIRYKEQERKRNRKRKTG